MSHDGNLSYLQPPSLARRSLARFQDVLGRFSAGEWYAKQQRLSGAVILVYHSVADGASSRWIDPAKRISLGSFKRQMQFLARHRKVVPLWRVVESLRSGKPLPAGSVAITFDDGYRDNLTEAFPVLAALGLPATVFIPSQHIEDRDPPWINRLYSAIVHRKAARLKLEHVVSFDGRLETVAQCAAAYVELSKELFALDYEPRKTVLAEIARQLDSDPIPVPIGMNWSDVRESIARYPGIEFGSHTVTHLDMSSAMPEVVSSELVRAKDSIETAIDKQVRYFAYPYSRVGKGDEARVAAAGYDAGFAGAEKTRVETDCCEYRIPRMDAPHSLGKLALVTSGAFPEISLSLFGHA